MKNRKFGSLTLFTLAVPVLLAFWPAGCSNSAARQVRSADLTKPGELVKATPEKGSTTFLPHPAFAYADSAATPGVSIADIAERVLPSVVNISSTRLVKGHPFMDDPSFRQFFGPMMPEGGDHREQGLGSGVIVSGNGLILTNNHVIDKADEIKVRTNDNREFDVEILGADEKSDLAVLRLKGDVKGLLPLKFADSSHLRLGDVVLAVGNPFGVGQTVTMGIVSAKGRVNLGIEDYEDFIQTDAAINPGNSGGALINMAGELVGINTAIFSRSGGSMGIGFAIPSNMAQPIANSLVKQGKVVRGWLGVGIQDLTTDLAKSLGLGVSNGVVITDVQKGSPAAKAGVARGDVVTSVGGEKVDSTGKLRNLIAAAGVSKVQLELLRHGSKVAVEVLLAEAPSDAPSREEGAKPQDRQEGLSLAPLNDSTRGRFNIGTDVTAGLVVVDIHPGSAAAEAGLRPGDVIVEFDSKPLRTVQEFASAYQRAKDRALLLVNRGGGTLFVVLKKK